VDANMTAKLNDICGIINQTVKTDKIYLFGSFACGVPHEGSDFDLYVVIPDDGPRPIDAMKQIRRALYKRNEIPPDILVGRAGEFERRRDVATIERKVYREGVVIHEQQASEQSMV